MDNNDHKNEKYSSDQNNSGGPGLPPGGNGNNQNGPNAPPRRGPNFLGVIIAIFVITVVMNLLFSSLTSRNQMSVPYSSFLELVDAGQVSTVQVETEQITFKLKEDASTDTVNGILFPEPKEDSIFWSMPEEPQKEIYYTGNMQDDGLIPRLEAQGITFTTAPVTQNSPILSFITSWILPFLLIYGIYFLLMRWLTKKMSSGEGGGGLFGGGMMGSVGKSKAKVYDVETSTGITFADVAGQDEAKESLVEMVDYLHNPGKYQAIGAKQPRGALLVGPPGTGKTLLAKAVAGEAKVPFYSLSGSEFVEMFVGVGASRVRDLFEQANKNAPCIIFIDEIDAIGKKRDNQLGGNDEREQTLNQLLAEMDGFDSSKGIVVLAATNRPEILDQALLRPGRFDRRVIVDKPDLPGREAILAVHAKKVMMGDDVDLHAMALATSGATGADLANMINEAALRAVKMGRDKVLQEDLMESVEVVIAGKEKKDRVLNPKERKIVSYHEVGHALVTALQKNAQPVQKITIVPRTMGSLGYTMNVPEEERYLMTKPELLAEITTLLGGRAAEEVVFGEISTGASNDIERATKIARSMVAQYGMSDTFGPMGLESAETQYMDGRNVQNCSAETGTEIDREVREILANCQKDAISLLEQHREALNRISEDLNEKENITGERFMELLREVEGPLPSTDSDNQ
ncbi:MAG: ATP-dependent zinc metalloprotease FtsH [Oscillospiraceae bacterium]